MSTENITTANGLLYRNGEVIHLPEADALARRHGHHSAEQMVKALESKVPEVPFEIVPKDIILPPAEKQSLITTFQPIMAKAAELLEESRGIKSAKMARVARLAFRKLRSDSDAIRKSLKEHHLLMNKAIEGAHNILVAAVQTEEKRMEDIEKAEERAEEERIENIRRTRHDLLVAVGVHESICNSPGLGRMQDDAFASLLKDSTDMHAARLERERKEAEEKLAKEVAAAQERERVRLENERLLKEAAEREAVAKVERERAAREKATLEAQLAAERKAAEEKAEYERKAAQARQDAADKKAREEKEALEAKHRAAQQKAAKEAAEREAALKRQQEAAEAHQRELEELKRRQQAEAQRLREEKEKQEREAAEAAERAALAPDKDKLIALAKSIRDIPVPKVKAQKAVAALSQFITKIQNLADWCEEKAQEL